MFIDFSSESNSSPFVFEICFSPPPSPRGRPPTAICHSFLRPQRALVVDAAQREAIARTRNAIVALSLRQCAIHPTSIGDVFDASAELGLSAADVLRPRHLHAVTQRAAGRAAQQPE